MKGKKAFLFFTLFAILILGFISPVYGFGWGNNNNSNVSSASYGTYTYNTSTLEEHWNYSKNNLNGKSYETYTAYSTWNQSGQLNLSNTKLLNGVLVYGSEGSTRLDVYEQSIQIVTSTILIPIKHSDNKGIVTIVNGTEFTTNYLEVFNANGLDSTRKIYQTTFGSSIEWTEDDLVTLSMIEYYQYYGSNYTYFYTPTEGEQKYLALQVQDDNNWYDWSYRITDITITYYSCDITLYQQEDSSGTNIRWIAVVKNVRNNIYQAELTIHCKTTSESKFKDKDEVRTVIPTKVYTSILNNDGSVYEGNYDGERVKFSEQESTYYIVYVLKLKNSSHKEYIGCDVSAFITVNDRASSETEAYRIV